MLFGNFTDKQCGNIQASRPFDFSFPKKSGFGSTNNPVNPWDTLKKTNDEYQIVSILPSHVV